VALRPSTVLKSQVLPNKVATVSRLKANRYQEMNSAHPTFRNPKHTLTGQTAVPAALFHNLTPTIPNFSLLRQQSPRKLGEGAAVPTGTRE